MTIPAFGKRPGGGDGRARDLPTGRTGGHAGPMQSVSQQLIAASRGGDGEASRGFSLKYFACFLFMLLLLGAFVYTTGSVVYRDFAHGSSFVADPSIKVERAECKRTNFVLTDCDIDLSWMTASGPKKQRAGFMLLFSSMADKAVVPLRSKSDPAVVSTQVALDHMTNRTITFMVFASILLMLVVIALRKAFPGAGAGHG